MDYKKKKTHLNGSAERCQVHHIQRGTSQGQRVQGFHIFHITEVVSILRTFKTEVEDVRHEIKNSFTVFLLMEVEYAMRRLFVDDICKADENVSTSPLNI